MAQFRVGQRVKCIRAVNSADLVPLGAEGVINEPLQSGGHYGVLWDNGADTWSKPESIVPLTAPSADAFLARLKKLGSEPVNDAPKVTVREGK